MERIDRNKEQQDVIQSGGSLRVEQNLVIFDRVKSKVFVEMQRSIFPSDLVQLGDIVLNISRRIPISLLKLVLLGIQVFFAIRDRYIFTKLETAVDTIYR